MQLTKILRASNWSAINRPLAKALGIEPAYFFSYLADKYEYFTEQKQLDADGFFYLTEPQVEEDLGLKRRAQDGAIRVLRDAGLVYKEMRGMPAKRHFKFHPDCDVKLCVIMGIEVKPVGCTKKPRKVVQNVQTRLYRKYKHGRTESTAIKNISIKKEELDLGNDKSFPLQKNTGEVEFAFFDALLVQRGFTQILKIKKRFTEKALAEKKAEIGEQFFEEIFWGVISRINSFLSEFPKKTYKCLAMAFKTFLGAKETVLGLYALNAYWHERFGREFGGFVDLKKSQKDALTVIATKIVAQMNAKAVMVLNDNQIIDGITKFFCMLPSRWGNPTYFKLETIAAEFPQVLAAIKLENANSSTGTAGTARPQTFAEIDAQNKALANAEEQARREQVYREKQVKDDTLRIMSYITSGKPMPQYLLNSEAWAIYQQQQQQQ